MSSVFASSSLFNVEREQFDEIEVEKSFPGWKNWPQDDEDVLNLVGLHVTNYSSVEHTHTPTSGVALNKRDHFYCTFPDFFSRLLPLFQPDLHAYSLTVAHMVYQNTHTH